MLFLSPNALKQTSLHETVYVCRTFGYLLACLVLTQLGADSLYLASWLVFLVVYPHGLQWFVERSGSNHATVRLSMLIDAVVVGLLISLTGFNLEASVVLTTLLGISILIVGGVTLLLSTSLMVVSGMIAGDRYHAEAFTGGTGFYFTSFGILVAYTLFIGFLVYRETRRLKFESRRERGLRRSLEDFRSQFLPYLAPQLLDRAQGRGRYRKSLTVLFCNMSGISSLVEQADGQVAATMIDQFFTTMTSIATSHGGTVERMTRDGIMVFFGDPLGRGEEEDALSCVEMALQMRAAFASLADRWQRDTGYPRQGLRIGVHTGECLVGEFGSDDRRTYTALGEPVDLAHRLESAAGDGDILVSRQVLRRLRGRLHFSTRGCVVLSDRCEEAFNVKNLA